MYLIQRGLLYFPYRWTLKIQYSNLIFHVCGKMDSLSENNYLEKNLFQNKILNKLQTLHFRGSNNVTDTDY